MVLSKIEIESRFSGDAAKKNFQMDMARNKFVEVLGSSLGLQLHLESPINRQNMSGTSMATPTVTGLLAKYILQKMKNEGIASTDVYKHPSLMPERIVSEALAMTKISPHSQVITIKMLTDGIETWAKSKGEVKSQKRLGSIFSKSQMNRVRCEQLFM